MKVAAVLLTLFLLALIVIYPCYRLHSEDGAEAMCLMIGWYLGVLMGCVTFYGTGKDAPTGGEK